MVSQPQLENLSSFQSRVITTEVTILEIFAAGDHGMIFFNKSNLGPSLEIRGQSLRIWKFKKSPRIKLQILELFNKTLRNFCSKA